MIFLMIDFICINCFIGEIYKLDVLIVFLYCLLNIMLCECFGMDFFSFIFEWINFDLFDSNNDQILDGILDENLIQKDCFI